MKEHERIDNRREHQMLNTLRSIETELALPVPTSLELIQNKNQILRDLFKNREYINSKLSSSVKTYPGEIIHPFSRNEVMVRVTPFDKPEDIMTIKTSLPRLGGDHSSDWTYQMLKPEDHLIATSREFLARTTDEIADIRSSIGKQKDQPNLRSLRRLEDNLIVTRLLPLVKRGEKGMRLKSDSYRIQIIVDRLNGAGKDIYNIDLRKIRNVETQEVLRRAGF